MSRGKLTWGRCDCCGGRLPLIDGDNDCGAPSHTGGECPGSVSPDGNCGCYDDDELAAWIADELDDELEAAKKPLGAAEREAE